MKTRSAVWATMLFAVIAGYFMVGPFLDLTPIGFDHSAFPAGDKIQSIGQQIWPDFEHASAGMFWVVVTLLAIAGLVFFAVRGVVRRSREALDPERRKFLTGMGAGALAGIGALVLAASSAAMRTFLGVGRPGRGWSMVVSEIFEAPVVETHPQWPSEWHGSRVRAHRRFGRTEWNVSDIVLGSGGIAGENGEKIVRAAIERGVNYIDTAPDYSASGSEQAIGRAIRGMRDQLFIATKFCTPIGHLPVGTPVAHYMHAVEESLRRLGTDYVDLCHIHSCNSEERLLDPNVHEAFDRLKQDGKVRFMGFSSHSPNLVGVANAAIRSERFDVMMLAYHHGIWDSLGETISRARSEQDMGVVAMKTLKGARHHGLAGFREHAGAYSQAALRWVLSNSDVSCAVISFYELQHVDEYLHASGGELAPADTATLDAYDREIRGSYCTPHCGACLDSCPEDLVIHDVLRQRMYAEDYGWQREGARLYAKLEKSASVCASCSAPCLGSCPVGIPIQQRMVGAHSLLTRSGT